MRIEHSSVDGCGSTQGQIKKGKIKSSAENVFKEGLDGVPRATPVTLRTSVGLVVTLKVLISSKYEVGVT